MKYEVMVTRVEKPRAPAGHPTGHLPAKRTRPPRGETLTSMTVAAKDTEVGRVYRPTGPQAAGANAYFIRAPIRAAKVLEKRLAKKGAHMRTDEAIELAAARDALAGRAVLFLRCMRGIDPLTKERWELCAYRALASDYKLRFLKRKPGYT